MGKGALRFHGKSGILPKPRQIFKQPYKHEVYVKPHDTGYADGILHPKGTTRELIRPTVITPEMLLERTAAKPKRSYGNDELKMMPEAQRYKVKNAELRRKFLKESYDAEVKRMEKLEARQKRLSEERKKVADKAQQHEKSKAELYTTPTVESILKGPMVKPRTEEQKEALNLKREANSTTQRISVKEHRAENLMDLYNESSSFAITEPKLQLLVDEAFSERKLKEISRLLSVGTDRLGTLPTSAEFENGLKDIILGQANNGPSYGVVEDSLNGYNDEIHSIALKAQEKKRQQLKKEADEKQRKLQQLQDEMIRSRGDKPKQPPTTQETS